MKFLKTILGWFAGILGAIVVGGVIFLFVQYNDLAQLSADINLFRQHYRVELFKRGYIDDLSSEDKRHIYQRTCYRKCHGEAAMLTAILSPAGWIQVVERMRLKEGLSIGGREAEVIIRYLEREYPTTSSPYTFSVRKATHKAVWRNDLGEGDVYTDVIYATPEYLKSVGMTQQIDEFEVNKYYVFILSFAVHEGVVPKADLDKVSFLKLSGSERIKTKPPWVLRFETADKHHYEGMIRFPRKNGETDKSGSMELIMENIGHVPQRTFHWDFPLEYPPEVLKEALEEKK